MTAATPDGTSVFLARPARDTQQTRDFANQIAPDSKFVGLRPQSVEDSQPRECVTNVDQAISVLGGTCVYGWQLWELFGGLLLVAEFHAVLESDSGDLIDVTPAELPTTKRSTFLPDPSLNYEGRQIKNRFRPLTQDGLIKKYVDAENTCFDVMNQPDVIDYYGPATPEMIAAMQRVEDVGDQIVAKYFPRVSGS